MHFVRRNRISPSLISFFIYSFNIISTVTEVIWEGKETEAKKADNSTTLKADSCTTEKADKAVTSATNRLIYILLL